MGGWVSVCASLSMGMGPRYSHAFAVFANAEKNSITEEKKVQRQKLCHLLLYIDRCFI